MECFICLQDDKAEPLVADVCKCKSSGVHSSCLLRWIEESATSTCPVCKEPYSEPYTLKQAKQIRITKSALYSFMGGTWCLVFIFFSVTCDSRPIRIVSLLVPSLAVLMIAFFHRR